MNKLESNPRLSDEFVKNNFGLVHSLANRFRGRGIEYEELFSAGCVGLMKAANGFDEERGLQFSTYAVPVILGEIKRLFRDGGTVKVSRGLKELSLKAVRLQEQLKKEGKDPRLSDLAEILEISVSQVSEALSVNLPPVSLTEKEEGGDYDIPIEAPQIKATEMIALKQSLSTLSPEDRRIIILRYWSEKTQSEVGEELGMSQVQVSRKEKKILAELREMMI